MLAYEIRVGSVFPQKSGQLNAKVSHVEVTKIIILIFGRAYIMSEFYCNNVSYGLR